MSLCSAIPLKLSLESARLSKASFVPGPLDKQIEVRTTDGRRRITPMYLPPVIENGAAPDGSQSSSLNLFGKNQMLSSSSGAKSKIAIPDKSRRPWRRTKTRQ